MNNKRPAASLLERNKKKMPSPGADPGESSIFGRTRRFLSSPRVNVKDDSQREKEAFALLCRSLIEHRWYHGVMPRGEINTLLEDEGDFCVRKTTEKSKGIVCLSIKNNSEVRHFPLVYEIGSWTVKNMQMDKPRKFYEVVELLDYLVTEKVSLSGAVLQRAVPRPDYYIAHEDIQLICKLGEGAFGEVWKGTFKRRRSSQELVVQKKKKSPTSPVGSANLPVDNSEVYVAVKKMKGNATKKMTEEFVLEAKLMRQLAHPNIVTVYGVAPSEEPLMIVLELAANGCLKSYVTKHQCPIDQLTQFTSDAARGMAYLSSKLVIHRDLAARNLLLGANVEVKISDFGLSSAGKEEVKINKMKLPIRWLAPETLEEGIFTTKTDVWSFAVTMWEIFSRCSSDPYPGMTNQQAKEKIKGEELPMEAPEDTPPSVVKIMKECFSKNPDERPTFAAILKRLCPSEDVTVYDRPSTAKSLSAVKLKLSSSLEKKSDENDNESKRKKAKGKKSDEDNESRRRKGRKEKKEEKLKSKSSNEKMPKGKK